MPGEKTRRLALLSLFLALAIAAGALERAVPFHFALPGVRLGLGNIVILLALYLFRFREALALALLKCVLVALYAGSFPSFAYSLTGTLLSLLAMALLCRLPEGFVGPVGVSIGGAALHNTGQILAAGAVMGTALVWGYLPILLLIGLGTGLVTGLPAALLLPRLRRILAAGRAGRGL